MITDNQGEEIAVNDDGNSNGYNVTYDMNLIYKPTCKKNTDERIM